MSMPSKYRSTSTGLGEIDVYAVNTNTYTIRVRLLLPTPQFTGGGTTSVVTTIAVNSSTKYTSNAGDQAIDYQIAATAGDTIKVTTSSSNPNDNVLNAIKVSLAISEGGSL